MLYPDGNGAGLQGVIYVGGINGGARRPRAAGAVAHNGQGLLNQGFSAGLNQDDGSAAEVYGDAIRRARPGDGLYGNAFQAPLFVDINPYAAAEDGNRFRKGAVQNV